MYKTEWRIIWDGGRKEDFTTIASTEQGHINELFAYMDYVGEDVQDYYKI